MFIYRFIQICVYIVLLLIGYGLYRLIEKPTKRLGDWLYSIGFYKSWWGNTILIILGLAYIFFFFKTGDQIELVYVDTDTNTIHLYEDCENIHADNLQRTFWFVAEHDGNTICEDCLDEREWENEKARERSDELRYP